MVVSRHCPGLPLPDEVLTHDNARPDAPPQELAQMEPGHRGGRVCAGCTSPVSWTTPRARGNRDVVATSTAARSPSRSSAASTSSRCSSTGRRTARNIDDRLLKQLGIDQRIVQQMIQEEALAGGSGAPRDQGQRRGGPASGSWRSRRSRRTASSSATSATGRSSQCRSRRCGRRVRGQVRRSIVSRKAAGARSPAGSPSPTPKSTPSSAAQRKGQACGRRVPGRQVPRGARRPPTRRCRSTSRSSKDEYRMPREAQGAVLR